MRTIDFTDDIGVTSPLGLWTLRVEYKDSARSINNAHVIEEYGAETVADLCTFDEKDKKEIEELLRKKVGGPAPLKIRWILKALVNSPA